MSITAPDGTAVGWSTMFRSVLRSEYCKFGSVRSTPWLLAAAVAFTMGVAALVAVLTPSHLPDFDPVSVSLGGLHLSQIAVGVLGVFTIANEYDTGLIRSTFAAVPRRGRVLLAKAVVLAASAMTAGTVASIGAFVVFQALVTDDSLRSSVNEPGVVRAILGGGLYLTLLGLMGLGLGALLRGSAAAIAVLLGIIFVPQLLMALLPNDWQTTITPYLPMEAGSQIYSAEHETDGLGFWSGLGTLALYAAAALGAGFASITRRDA